MKSNLTLAIAVVLITGLFTSCSTSVQITKRHYKSGYYVDISTKKAQKSEVKQEKGDATINRMSSTVEGEQSERALVQQQLLQSPAKQPQRKKNQLVASVAQPEQKELIMNRVSQAAAKIAASTPSAPDIGLDQQTLLILWIACLVAAILFGALGHGFGVIAVLLGVAALVFFIFWILDVSQ